MQFLKNSDEEINIGLTSLIDVIFLLLIFFMVTTTLIDPSKKIDIQLPEAKAASRDTKSVPVTIELGTLNKISLNGKPVSFKNLESRLLAIGRQSGKKVAIVRADKRLDYGLVVRVLGICRSSGFQDIGISVK